MSGLRFSEHMEGWVSFSERTFNQALHAGREAGTSCSFDLRMRIEDIDEFVRDPTHAASIHGTVHCDELGGELTVQRGVFNLFVDEGDVRHKRMRYRLFLHDRDQRPLTLSGFKEIEDDPNLDIWSDTTRLLVRILAGHWETDPHDDHATLATGVLFISHTRLARMLASMRGQGGTAWSRAKAMAKFQKLFVEELHEVYRGPESRHSEADFPALAPAGTRWQGHPPGAWHDLPDRPGLRRRILPFTAGDGFQCTLHHIRGETEPALGPVLLVHGCASRANLFYGAPTPTTIVDELVGAGYDVWLENWRASIDLPPNPYTLDQAAVFDHPAAIQTIKRETGADTLKAIVHCQGSTSFTMAAVAGLVPEVTTVVANSCSLHVNVTRRSLVKMSVLMPLGSLLMRGVDPQWTIRPPSAISHAYAAMTRLVRHECDNHVCSCSQYSYGVGPDLLWRHSLLEEATHSWICREFGYAPFSFFRQIARCARRGHLVPVDGLPALPEDLFAEPPQTDARFTFTVGERNRCFLPAGQRRSFEYFDRLRPGYHAFHELPGYSHLDLFFGRRAHREVIPLIVDALGSGPAAPVNPSRRFERGRRATVA